MPSSSTYLRSVLLLLALLLCVRAGAVTYREAALLIDEHESSLATRQRVAQVVCHELSHQWFGNLVTMVRFEQYQGCVITCYTVHPLTAY